MSAPAKTMADLDRSLSRRSLLAGGLLAGVAFAGGLRPAFAAPLTQYRPAGSATFDHAAFDALVADVVKPDGSGYNRVDYDGVKARLPDLRAYIAALEAADPAAMSRNEAHAYWINLYNAKTLEVVAEAYPVKSIKDIDLGGSLFGGGPWKARIMTVSGRDLSLDMIEHDIVRPLFSDPMSHYGLNCASYSCPNLATRAFTGSNVDALLEENARAYVGHPRGVVVKGGRITASKIYDWYADDFGGEGNLKDHWTRLADAEKAAEIAAAAIGRFTYDWSINDV